MRLRHVAVLLACVLTAGCTITTATAKKTTKTSVADEEPVETVVTQTPGKPGKPVEVPIAQPTRDGHALQWVGTKPSDGIQIKVSGLGTERPTMNYQPDPPDAVISLGVPATSLGASVKRVAVNFTYGSKTLKGDPFPMATVRILPGDPVKVTVPIGSQILRGAFTGPEAPTDLQANVTFFDEADEPIVSQEGVPLTVVVPIQVDGG